MTVTSKATGSPSTCRLRVDGSLTKPRVPLSLRRVHSSTERANLVSPLDGDSFAQVVKVDLLHLKAQVFDIDEQGSLVHVRSARTVDA